MTLLLKLSQLIDLISERVGKGAFWLVLIMTIISSGNAVVRFVFNYSSNGLLEIQWYLFAWSFLVAAGYTLLHREHVRIDVLNSRLPKKVQVWIDIIGFAFFLTPLCLLVLWLGVPMLMDKFASGEVSPNTGGLVRWPVWLALPIGFVLLLLQGWSELIKRIAFLRGQGPDPMGRLTDQSAEEELAAALRREAEVAAAANPAAPGAPAPQAR